MIGATDIFVSYKAEDRARLQPLVSALEAEGFTVWWDTHIGGGAHWREDIQEHLDAAKCVIVAWSRRSVGPEGDFVRDEAARARKRGTYLPVRLDMIEPPLGFGEIQAISLKGWNGDGADLRFLTLCEAVRRRIAGEDIAHLRLPLDRSGASQPPLVGSSARAAVGAATGASAQISRRTVLIGGGAVVALAGGAVGWNLLSPDKAAAANSIAVLPFANLSGDANKAYFSNGIAEELRSALSRLEGLRVAGRISSEAVRDEDAATVGRRLRVASILIGSVRQAPGMIRISSQLIGRDGIERWSESYDRPEGNVLAIQTDIAEKVVAALSIELGRAEIQALTAGGTSNAVAYDLYLRATHQVRDDDSEASLQQANVWLDSAIAKDPSFASAYAAKSHNLSYLADIAHSPKDTAKGYAAAENSARRALELAPSFSGGYASLADALYGERKIKEAISQIKVGLNFTPNQIELLQAAVIAFVAVGQTTQALAYADQMIEIDPLNSLSHRRRYYALFYDRQFDACIAEAQQTLKLAPTLTLPPLFIAWSLILTDRAKDAQPYLAMLPMDLTVRLASEAIVDAKLGNRASSDRKLEQLALSYGDAASYQFAQVFAQRGEPDRAFASLKRGFSVNDPGLNTLLVDPLLDPIRRDPRFAELSKQMNFAS